MSHAENKAERLLKMEALLLAHPEGLTQSEMARHLGVDRSTINRNLYDFQKIYPTIEHDDGRISLDRSAYLVKVAFTLHEATAVHIAARLLATRMDRQNPHAASALRKLGVALEKLAPRISAHVKQSADVMDDASQWQDPRYLDVLEALTLAWAELHKVRVWHRSDKAQKVLEYLLCPYFIEPYAVGQTTHLIARDESTGKLRTLKIERIERVEVTREHYEIPSDFDPRDLLADAWGVWYTTSDPVEVTLKFSRAVASRLEETRWHRSEEETKLEDGSILWKAKVAEPQEMIPWIRGWGADCEVVEPDWLRERLVKEVKRIARVYGVEEAKPEDDLIAHVRKDGEEQRLVTHLAEASQLAERFAAKVDLPEIGKIMGLLHDFGKASKEFQEYLRSATGRINPDEDEFVDYEAKKGKIDHSTAGAQLIFEKLKDRGQEGKILAQFLALAIASHHSGLIDCLKPDGSNDFERRMSKDKDLTHLTEARGKLPNIEKQLGEILAQPIEKKFVEKLKEIKEPNDSAQTLPFKHGLLARFLLSCVLEADRLNTADFEHPENEAVRSYGQYVPWDVLIERLEARYAEYAQKTAEMPPGRAREVNEIRAQVAQACLEAAEKPKGIYQLTVPTGGGKTEASLRFALHHARAHGMDRIFYIVPYITIIDQNADKVRDILEKTDERGEVVLEHHSNFVPSDDTRKRHNLLAENWDAPIVFTTQVQFLEALFGYGTRDARRMHQLANSVIIFDEVQTIPIRITHMFTTALRFLTHDCGASVVLCTATQPPFDKTGNPYRELNIPQENHIIKNEPELFQRLKRVEVHDERKPGGLTNAEIADRAAKALQEKGSVLIVVNTRPSAKALYEAIKERQLGAAVYHLSTNMCPAHRMDKLDEIRDKLKKKESVICVSTQLIEAGVDIDFGAVIRALAGLDSIAQSAGRCNRHGMREDGGDVWVVNVREENLSPLPDIQLGRNEADTILNFYKRDPAKYDEDALGLKTLEKYYVSYFKRREDELNYPVGPNDIDHDDNLFNLLARNVHAYKGQVDERSLKQSFMTASKIFRVIDSPTIGVIVPYGEGREIITALCGDIEIWQKRELLKRAQRYSVQLYLGRNGEFVILQQKGAIHAIRKDKDEKNEEIYYLVPQHYNAEFGWSKEPEGNQELLCF